MLHWDLKRIVIYQIIVLKIEATDTKKCAIIQELKCKHYRNCLETNWLENKKKLYKKVKFDVDILRENHKEFLKDNRSILKSQKRIISEKNNIIVLNCFVVLYCGVLAPTGVRVWVLCWVLTKDSPQRAFWNVKLLLHQMSDICNSCFD